MEIPRQYLLKLVRKVDSTGCWEWLGPVDAYGFGRMYSGDREYKAHKVFYETRKGELPAAAYLHHLPQGLCIGRLCCNPEHQVVGCDRRGGKIGPPHPKPVSRGKEPEPVCEFIDPDVRRCPLGHPLTPGNIVVENRKGHPKIRCRICRRASWRKNSARRSAAGLHT